MDRRLVNAAPGRQVSVPPAHSPVAGASYFSAPFMSAPVASPSSLGAPAPDVSTFSVSLTRCLHGAIVGDRSRDRSPRRSPRVNTPLHDAVAVEPQSIQDDMRA